MQVLITPEKLPPFEQTALVQAGSQYELCTKAGRMLATSYIPDHAVAYAEAKRLWTGAK